MTFQPLQQLVRLGQGFAQGGANSLGLLDQLPDVGLARLADIVNAFPAIVGAVALLGLAGGPLGGLPPSARVGLVIALFSWPSLFRFMRAEVTRWSRSEIALAARAAGAGRWRLGLRHLMPLALTPVLVPAAFLAGGAVLVEAGLGFLGLGIRPPEPSWGNLLREGMTYVGSAWWLALFPGLAVFLTVLAFHLLADGLRQRVGADQVDQSDQADQQDRRAPAGRLV
ncbi:MAG: ABC transporter permease [Acidobacteriota bacterium]|nr:MAG: ABC transporter permease [Acidobacteriota bacterium]